VPKYTIFPVTPETDKIRNTTGNSGINQTGSQNEQYHAIKGGKEGGLAIKTCSGATIPHFFVPLVEGGKEGGLAIKTGSGATIPHLFVPLGEGGKEGGLRKSH
jgi:hypothetical protein